METGFINATARLDGVSIPYVVYVPHDYTPQRKWPVALFLHGAYDYTCETIDSQLAQPMREHCANLTEAVVPSGHWMAQEQPARVNAELARWLSVQAPQLWLGGGT